MQKLFWQTRKILDIFKNIPEKKLKKKKIKSIWAVLGYSKPNILDIFSKPGAPSPTNYFSAARALTMWLFVLMLRNIPFITYMTIFNKSLSISKGILKLWSTFNVILVLILYCLSFENSAPSWTKNYTRKSAPCGKNEYEQKCAKAMCTKVQLSAKLACWKPTFTFFLQLFALQKVDRKFTLENLFPAVPNTSFPFKWAVLARKLLYEDLLRDDY